MSDVATLLRIVATRLRHERDGLAVVELALVMPFLLLLVVGVSDASLGFSRRLVLQQAAARAAEMASAKGYDDNTAIWSQNEAATAASVPTAQVTATTWLECGGVAQASVSGTCTSGTTARYISIAVTDSYTSTFAPLLKLLGAGDWSAISLRGYATARLQ